MNQNHQSYLVSVFSFNVISFSQSVVGIPVPTINLDWFTATYNLSTWNYWWFQWPAGIWVRHLVGLPFTGLFLWGVMVTLMPVLVQVANVMINLLFGIRGALGGLFGAVGGFLR